MSVKVKVILTGLFMVFASIWVCAAVFHYCEDWTHFPAYATACIVAALGIGITINSAAGGKL